VLRRFGGEFQPGNDAMSPWQRQQPAPSETSLLNRSIVRKLWKRKLPSGEEISAVSFFDNSLGECTLEITVLCAHAPDVVCMRVADGVLAALEERGAVAMEEVR
jgi:hypothetical protein